MLKDDKGKIHEWFGAASDVTERKKVEEEAKAANRELESFSYSVSHDLRSPLRAISGFSFLLREHAGLLDSKASEYLQRIEAAAKKMNLLIDAMLRLSHFSRQEMNIQNINLSRVVKDVAGELEQQHKKRKVEICISDDLKGQGDEQLLRIVLSNLLGNAWKYTEKTIKARIEFGSC